MSQEKWEKELEDALCEASPTEVLAILKRIKCWLAGYCETCGTYNDMYGGKRGCNCLNKGEWA